MAEVAVAVRAWTGEPATKGRASIFVRIRLSACGPVRASRWIWPAASADSKATLLVGFTGALPGALLSVAVKITLAAALGRAAAVMLETRIDGCPSITEPGAAMEVASSAPAA